MNRNQRAGPPKKNDLLIIMEKIPNIYWEYLECLLKYMKNCYELTAEIQNSDETLSIAYLAYKELVNDKLNPDINEYIIIKQFVEDLKESLKVQFQICERNDDILLCCLIDTRTLDFLENNRLFFSIEEYNKAKRLLRSAIEGISAEVVNIAPIPMTGKYDKYRDNTSSIEHSENEFNRWIASKDLISTKYFFYHLIARIYSNTGRRIFSFIPESVW